MDWLNLLAVQGTCKGLLQHHTSKASILQRSAFFTVQLSHPYMTTGKTIALTRWNVVGKVMFLLLNMLSRLVITFLPRSKSLNLMAAITICSDFGAPKDKVSYCFHCFPIYFPWSDGTGCQKSERDYFLNPEDSRRPVELRRWLRIQGVIENNTNILFLNYVIRWMWHYYLRLETLK